MANKFGIAYSMTFCAVAALSLSFAPPAMAAGSMSVHAGKTVVVKQTTHLKALTIADKASLMAPKGYNLTLTVDGIGTPIEAGKYKGKVVLSVTKDILVQYVPTIDIPNYKLMSPEHFRAAVYV